MDVRLPSPWDPLLWQDLWSQRWQDVAGFTYMLLLQGSMRCLFENACHVTQVWGGVPSYGAYAPECISVAATVDEGFRFSGGYGTASLLLKLACQPQLTASDEFCWVLSIFVKRPKCEGGTCHAKSLLWPIRKGGIMQVACYFLRFWRHRQGPPHPWNLVCICSCR